MAKVNREKQNEYNRRYYSKHIKGNTEKTRKRNPEPVRKYHLKYKFGITQEEYSFLLEIQDNKCAICRLEETNTYKGKVRNLAVDHDHETGEVRALLCRSCNIALGGFKDSIELLEKAVRYIKLYKN